jgi:hypothetical protein
VTARVEDIADGAGRAFGCGKLRRDTPLARAPELAARI